MKYNIGVRTFVCRPVDNLQVCLKNSIVTSEDPILPENIISITQKSVDRTLKEVWAIFYREECE